MTADELYIKRCLEISQRAKGTAFPNPFVGAVLVHDNRIIGEGLHEAYGYNHAEVNCLESVKEEDKQLIPEATMYVNLEPCAHHGKTPPCALRLVKERVKKVVVCNADPFEEVDGKGFKILADNGIEYQSGILEQEGLWVNRRFFCFHTQKRPYIILKWAQTHDGYIAPTNRKRFQISNGYSAGLVHKWRAEEAAIIVGKQTALHDNPRLTSRDWKGASQPLRIVLDRNLEIPETFNLYNDDARTWFINEQYNKVEKHLSFINLKFDDTLLLQIMSKLHEANILSLIVEGGAALLHSFIDAGLWDEARIFTSEKLLEEGVAAPLLSNSEHIMNTALDSDELDVYLNSNSEYKYIQGLQL